MPISSIKAALDKEYEPPKTQSTQESQRIIDLRAKFNIPSHIHVVVEDSETSSETSKMMASFVKRIQDDEYNMT